MKKTGRLAALSLFTVISLTIHLIEDAFPLPIPIPGIKPGLANVITLIVLRNYRLSDAFCVLTARIFLSAVFSGQLMSLWYSAAGGLLCLLVMYAAGRFLQNRFLPLISILGALAHNAGQLGAAYLLVRTPGILSYLPFLVLSGILTGLFTGLCAHYAQIHLIPFIRRTQL